MLYVCQGLCCQHRTLLIVRLFGEGVHLPSQPARVLAHRQIVAFNVIGVAGTTDRRRLEHRFSLGEGPVDHACGDVDDPTMLPLFHHDGITHVGR
jgi:hypothetical protein